MLGTHQRPRALRELLVQSRREQTYHQSDSQRDQGWDGGKPRQSDGGWEWGAQEAVGAQKTYAGGTREGFLEKGTCELRPKG